MKIYMVNQGELKEQSQLVFSTGDAYIIDNESKIWIWLGKDCSVDEKGTAAVEARRLDDERGGAAKIITVDQGEEVAEFLSLVNGVKIVDKNLAKSMLKDVQTGSYAQQASHVNTLYRISSEEFDGINAMKYVQVPFAKSSLDSEDAFIADLGDQIWIWQGKTCNVKEKVKAREFAVKFDEERAGSQIIKVFEEGEDAEFIEALEKGHIQKIIAPDLKVEKEPVAPSPVVFEEPKVEAPKPEPPAPKVEAPKPEPPAPKVEAPKPEVKKPEPTIKIEKPVAEPKKVETADDSNITVLVQHGGGRLKCPKCGEVNKFMIREVQDRTNIVMDYPLIYGKKYICGKCGSHWRVEE